MTTTHAVKLLSLVFGWVIRAIALLHALWNSSTASRRSATPLPVSWQAANSVRTSFHFRPWGVTRRVHLTTATEFIVRLSANLCGGAHYVLSTRTLVRYRFICSGRMYPSLSGRLCGASLLQETLRFSNVSEDINSNARSFFKEGKITKAVELTFAPENRIGVIFDLEYRARTSKIEEYEWKRSIIRGVYESLMRRCVVRTSLLSADQPD